MDTYTPPTSWVALAVKAMKRTDVYQRDIKEGTYETVPVPV